MAGVVVRLLGPVEVVGPQGPAGLIGMRQRGLLGLLGLSPGAVLARERLIDALWGEDPPRTAVRDEVDACRFEDAVRDARRAEPVAGLRAALELWRGDALTDCRLDGAGD